MTAAYKRDLVSIRDYLKGELAAPVKHEYLGGVVYAMAGACNLHNRIAMNTLGTLHARLLGKPCQPFTSDTKIRIRMPTQTRFYYPDGSVVCQPNSETDSYQDAPAALIEVLSRSTRRIDEGEKKDAYLTIASLCVYLLVEQDAPVVTVHRRTEAGFVREVYQGLAAVIPLSEIGVELPLAAIYAGVTPTPEPSADDDA